MITGLVSCIRRPPLPLLLLIFLVLPGCALRPPLQHPQAPPPIQHPEAPLPSQRPESPDVPIQPPPSVQTGPAHSLYAEAKEALASGHPGQAEMLLERALRIEPRNAFYWHLLGQSKFAQGEFAQAVQFCHKSESLARDNGELRSYNRSLLAQAYKKLEDIENAKKVSQ